MRIPSEEPSVLARFRISVVVRLLLLGTAVSGLLTPAAAERVELRLPLPAGTRQTMWDMRLLSEPPPTFEAAGFAPADGLRPLFFESVEYQGALTRVFAWCGVPEGASPVPGMVLVHGGGGTAFRSWVKTWVDRGYAAVAMDTCGSIPRRPDGQTRGWQRHAHGGPAGWGGFGQTDAPVHDQWTYHAVAAVVRAHSMLRALPGVDAERIGVTGISWGGYLATIVAGVDSRFRLAAPVYGCGFLGENSAWRGRLVNLGPERGLTWLRRWDPSQYVVFARCPMLFCTGTNDHFYPLDSWRKTYRAAPGQTVLCCRVRMVHSHPPHGDPPEIAAFADWHLKNGAPLIEVERPRLDGRVLTVQWRGTVHPVEAILCYTQDSGNWEKRSWAEIPAALDPTARRVSAPLPPDATVAFVNLIDSRGLIVSSEHLECTSEP